MRLKEKGKGRGKAGYLGKPCHAVCNCGRVTNTLKNIKSSMQNIEFEFSTKEKKREINVRRRTLISGQKSIK